MSVCKWSERGVFPRVKDLQVALRSRTLGLVGLAAQHGASGPVPTGDPAAHIQTKFGMFKCRIWVQSHFTDTVESWRSGDTAVGAHGLNSLVPESLMGGFCTGILCLVPRQIMPWALLTLIDKADRFSCFKVKTQWLTIHLQKPPCATHLPHCSAPGMAAGLGHTP